MGETTISGAVGWARQLARAVRTPVELPPRNVPRRIEVQGQLACTGRGGGPFARPAFVAFSPRKWAALQKPEWELFVAGRN